MEAEPLSVPDSTALATHEKKKKRIVGAIAAVVLGGAAYGGYVMVSGMSDGMTELGGAYDALNTCMIGEPLSDGETMRVRMSGIELALSGMTGAERAERGADWPNECTVHAHRLSEAAAAIGSRGDALADAATKLAADLESHQAEPPAAAYSAVTDAAAAIELTPKVASSVRQPPKPKARPSVDTLPATARLSEDGFNPGHLHTEPFQSRDVYFLMDEENLPGGPQLCDYRPDGKKLVCTALPKRVAKKSPHLRLWGTTEPGGQPFLYVGDRGKNGIYRSSDGKRIGKKLIYGASAKKSGSLVATMWSKDDEELKLAELRRGEKNPTTEKLLAYEESGNPYYHTGLFWDWFVYRDFNDDHELRLYARRIQGVGKWGKLIDVGPLVEPSKVLPDDPPHLDACRDGATIVVRARGLQVDRLAFFDGKQWKPPVVSVGLAGALTCFNGEAVITQQKRTRIWQNRCTAKGCERVSFALENALRDRKSKMPGPDDPVTAAEAGGSLAVAWRAPGDGLRLIVGRANTLDKTTGQLVIDEKIAGGQLSMTPTVLHHRLLPGRGYALLVASTIKGNFVYEVSANGAITPVTVERATRKK